MICKCDWFCLIYGLKKTKITDRNPTIPRFAQLSHLRTPLLIGIFIKPLETFHRCSEDFMSQISIVYLYFFRLSVHHEIATCCDERKIKLKPSFLSDACSSCTSIPVVFSVHRMNKSTCWLCFLNVSMETRAFMWNNKWSNYVNLEVAIYRIILKMKRRCLGNIPFESKTSWHHNTTSVADSGFPRGFQSQRGRQPITWHNFCQKIAP